MGLQQWLPQHALSHWAGKLANCRWRWWKNWAIRFFIKRYQIDLALAENTDLNSYPHFNAFFTRQLRPGARPIVQGQEHIASPVDGCISQIGKIRNDLLLQAKGFYFNLSALLGGSETYSRGFFDGSFATLYLAPRDYHRVHMPLQGKLVETIYVPGKLFSVSQQTVRTVPQLFARNERLVSIFETAIGPMALVLVGAIIVGSIEARWPIQRSLKIEIKSYAHDTLMLERGAEMGHFNIGSTVIVLFPKNTMNWDNRLQVGSAVKMGESLGIVL